MVEPVTGNALREGSGQAPHRVEGRVTAQMPSGLYHVDVDGSQITAHIGGTLERNFVRLLIGDRVVVELTPRDLSRGRIVRKA